MGKRGVTLLELLMVIAIMAIMAGFATVGVDMIRREEVRSATRELMADLLKARMTAMTSAGSGAGVRFASGKTYTLFNFNDCNHDFTYDDDGCLGGQREETQTVHRQITSTSTTLYKTSPGRDITDHIIWFDRLGVPRSATGGFGLLTVIVQGVNNGGAIRCVAVSVGRVREGVWSGDRCI